MRIQTTKNISNLKCYIEKICFYSGEKQGEYLAHRDVESGTGRNLAKVAYGVLEVYSSLESLEAVLVDNTVTNTGYKGGT